MEIPPAHELRGRIEEIEQLRKSRGFKSEYLHESANAMFSSIVNRETILAVYRNLHLWQMAGATFKKSIPEVITWPPKTNLHGTQKLRLNKLLNFITQTPSPVLSHCLEDYFAKNPNLIDYFATFGCPNLFQQYLSLERLQQAEQFFTNQINVRFSKFLKKTIANFILHANRFMKTLRERFLQNLANGHSLTDPDKISALKAAFDESVLDLTEQHVNVLKKCLETDRSTTHRLLVRKVLVPCLKMWEESDQFAATTLLRSTNGNLWELLIDKTSFDYDWFCNDASKRIFVGTHSLSPDFADFASKDHYRILSLFDLYFLVDLGRDARLEGTSFKAFDCPSANIEDVEKAMSWFYTDHGSFLRPVCETKMPNLPPGMERGLYELRKRALSSGRDPLELLPGIDNGEVSLLTACGVHLELALLQRTDQTIPTLRNILPSYRQLCEEVSELREQVHMLSTLQARSAPFICSSRIRSNADRVKWLDSELSQRLDSVALLIGRLYLSERCRFESKEIKVLENEVKAASLWKHRKDMCSVLYDTLIKTYQVVTKKEIQKDRTFAALIRFQLSLFKLYSVGQINVFLDSLQVARSSVTWSFVCDHVPEGLDEYLWIGEPVFNIVRVILREITCGTSLLDRDLRGLSTVYELLSWDNPDVPIRYVFHALFDDNDKRKRFAARVGEIQEVIRPILCISSRYRKAVSEIRDWFS